MSKHTPEEIQNTSMILSVIELVLLIWFSAITTWSRQYIVLLWFGWLCLATTLAPFRKDYWE